MANYCIGKNCDNSTMARDGEPYECDSCWLKRRIKEREAELIELRIDLKKVQSN